MRYKIHIPERDYSQFELFDAFTLQKISTQIHLQPAAEKLFSNDLFEWDESKEKNKCLITHSTVRVGGSYPGILVLDQNKTYGRYKKRLLYKCIPDDNRLPIFLVPYEIKQGFFKKMVNKYITFKYQNWDGKHPQGTITNIIGNVTDLNHFYEYQLFCKSLNDSIQNFTKATRESLKKKSEKQYIDYIKTKYPQIEDRTDQHIISIDPEYSKDFDDALGFIDIGNGSSHEEGILSIYIANVSIWMEVLNLWESFSKRISTIYLPDRKRPMLPTILSDNLCSLQENQNRVAFCMDVYIKNNIVADISFHNAIINVSRNFRYEDKELERNDVYKKSLHFIHLILKNYKYLDSVKNSHDLVTWTMIFMNHECAKCLEYSQDGIYRSMKLTQQTEIPENLPKDIKKHITIWHCTGGQYKCFTDKTGHDMIGKGLQNYIHITSPIRRLVDLLNILRLQDSLGLIFYSEKAVIFYKKWLLDMEYINTTMRAIRRVQNDCSLLNLCFTNREILEREYDGCIFDKLERNDGLFQYMVYLSELKINARLIHADSLENYQREKFKIYTFTDENSLKRKIRLQLI